MAAKCEFSTLHIPNDTRYAAVAATYAGAIARLIGFENPDIGIVEQGVARAVDAVIEYSFEPHEKATLEISCERVPEGLKVTLRDRGLPFDTAVTAGRIIPNHRLPQSDRNQHIFGLNEYMHDVRLNNLGAGGKEIVLIRHLKNRDITDYCAACELEPYQALPPDRKGGGQRSPCSVRKMKPSEAVEISKSVYKTYGYTYPHEYVYFPEKIIALNDSGRLHSAVAIADGEKIAGHCALQYWELNPQVAEMSQGVIKPEFRSSGCFTALSQYLIQLAGSEGLLGVFGQAVTTHTFSQKTGHRFGLKDCAVLLGHIPTTIDFKGIDAKLAHRGSMVLQFKYLRRPSKTAICPAPHHRDIIRRIFENLGIKPSFGAAAVQQRATGASVFSIKVLGTLNFARIAIEHYGQDIVPEIKSRLRALSLKKIEIINLFLNISDPLTARLTAQFEQLGFFFAGIMPGGLPGADAFILQYLNNVPLNYDAIRVDSTMAAEMIAHIRRHDPNSMQP